MENKVESGREEGHIVRPRAVNDDFEKAKVLDVWWEKRSQN